MRKLERLLNLTAALLETERPLSAADVHERVPGYPDHRDSYLRAFERDKEDLREMGVPVVVEKIPGTDPPLDGYRIPKDRYYLADPGLEPDELAALHLAIGAVGLDGTEGREGLWKLGGTPGRGDGEPVTIMPVETRLETIFDAVAERRRVNFDYRGRIRAVDPYRLDFHRGRWYLAGFDHTRAEERYFRLDRIAGPVDAGPGGSFDRPATGIPGRPLWGWEHGADEPVEARVVVDAVLAGYATRLVGTDRVAQVLPDGSVVLAVTVVDRAAFRAFVLDLLDHAVVASPDDLRAEITEWLETMVGTAP